MSDNLVEILITDRCGSGWSTQHTRGTPNWRHVLTYKPIIDFINRKDTSLRFWCKLLQEMAASAPMPDNWYMFLTTTEPTDLQVIRVPDDGVLIIEIEGYEKVFLKEDMIALR